MKMSHSDYLSGFTIIGIEVVTQFVVSFVRKVKVQSSRVLFLQSEAMKQDYS